MLLAQLLRSLALEGWSVLGIGLAEGDERLRRVTVQSQRRPALAVVAALPELTVGEAGEQAPVGGE